MSESPTPSYENIASEAIAPPPAYHLPAWKAHERQAMIDSIIRNNPDLVDRELRGVVRQSTAVFDEQVVNSILWFSFL